MKKIFTICLLFSFTLGKAQVTFEKNSKVITASYNLGVYSTKSHDKVANTNKNDGAASQIVNLGFEYGVLNWLGIGLKGQYDTYFTETDTLTGRKPKITGLDGGLVVNLHFLRKKRINMLAGFDLGVSKFKYAINDGYNSQATGIGSMTGIHLHTRFFFTDNVGMFINLAYAGFNYPNLTVKSDLITTSLNAFSIKGNGANIGLGIQVKF